MDSLGKHAVARMRALEIVVARVRGIATLHDHMSLAEFHSFEAAAGLYDVPPLTPEDIDRLGEL